MKKFLFALCGLLFTFNANAGQMANVEYIHQLIKQEHNIDIKYSPDLISPRQAANMKYLLTAVDVANEILNGKKTTDYGNGEFATRVAVDTTATIQAVRTLIKQDYKFFITTTPDTTEFSFKIQASGEFMVDWGDGKTEKIVKNDTSNQTYSHTYDTAGEYTIKMGGKATGYTTVAYYPSSTFSTIYFPNVTNIAKIDGSLGEIFSTLPDGTNPIFMYTFRNARITTLPEELFRNISGTMSERMFYGTFQNSNISGEISEKLFSGIAGRQRKQAFDSTFAYCLNLTSIPENLFKNITEADFSNTFEGCTGLTSIPENLFKNITYATFSDTFDGCTGLTSIPENLFKNITDATFSGTFKGCTGLTSIPENLFANITFTNITNANFSSTFEGCTGLTSIPENLFANITFTNITDARFSSTFKGCTALTSIPENLFKNITYATFSGTFEGCTALTSIPENLFAGISGAPAGFMFYSTFYGCSGLSGSIPENLFAGIKGAPAEYMFAYTFYGCSGLSGYIPPELFAGIGTDTTADSQMSSVFSDTGLDTVCPSGTVQYTTGFESWFDGRVSCEPYVPNATLTTTTTPGRFMIRMTAIGNFTIDWGDGNVEKITRHDTNDTEYWHDYGNADQSYSIKITGRATGYSDDPYRAAISFRENTQLAYVNGELGEIFPTLDDGTQPGFYETFYGCTGMTEISPTLFAGISGAPRARMFGSTFRKCSSLTEIPADLFAGISGAPAANVFDATFQECYNLTTIPENLFGGIYGTPAPEMFMRTFHNCSRLTSIPENLFGNISGSSANNMFNNMFEGCSSITSYSARINGEFLYNIWPNIQTWAYVGCNNMADYSTMPNSWK